MKWLSVQSLPAGGLVGGGRECVCSVRVCEPPRRGAAGQSEFTQANSPAVLWHRVEGPPSSGCSVHRFSMHANQLLARTKLLLDVDAERDAMHRK